MTLRLYKGIFLKYKGKIQLEVFFTFQSQNDIYYIVKMEIILFSNKKISNCKNCTVFMHAYSSSSMLISSACFLQYIHQASTSINAQHHLTKNPVLCSFMLGPINSLYMACYKYNRWFSFIDVSDLGCAFLSNHMLHPQVVKIVMLFYVELEEFCWTKQHDA